MKNILGLDLGTNSIGWAIITNDEKRIDDKGVVIFSEGVKNENGKDVSPASERTSYRSARKLKFRRKLRKYETLKILAEYKLCPLDIEEVFAWRKSGFKNYPGNPAFLEWLQTNDNTNQNPYYFRDLASRQKIGKLELGRAFYHIAQRRGFLSNRLDQSDKGIIEKHQPELDSIIDESGNVAELQRGFDEHFGQLDIIYKKSKELDEGDKALKKLYTKFCSILKKSKDTGSAKKELKERLFHKENAGVVKEGISNLTGKMNSTNSKTLGQYFWKLYQEDRCNEDNKIRRNYTAREEHYLHEFEIICSVQQLDEINKTQKKPANRYTGIVKELYNAIFYQRPLKSQKGLVGKCPFEKTKPRCPISRPEFEEFRMYSFINTIRIKSPLEKKYRSLTTDERNRIIPKFLRKSNPTFSFIDIKNTLGKVNDYNYKDNAAVSGCPTIASLKHIFGNDWKNKIYEVYSKKTTNKKITKTKDEVIADIWHVLNTFDSDEKLEKFAADNLKLSKTDAQKFGCIHLKKDYASLSLKAINKILPYLKDGLLYSHAIFMANMQNIVKNEIWANTRDRKQIQEEVGKIINNHGTENQINSVINSLIKRCKENNYQYSSEADNLFRDDLDNLFENEFGKLTWAKKKNRDAILEDSHRVFIKQLKEIKFVAMPRLDEKVIDFLEGNNLTKNEKSSEHLYHPSDIEKFKPEKAKTANDEQILILGSPLTGSIKNPMAMRTLHQVRRLVNTLLMDGRIDVNTKIHIETARELNDANKRKALQRWQNDQKNLHEIYEKKIRELYLGKTGKEICPTTEDIEKFKLVLEQRTDMLIITKEEILKYKLWDEQKHICLYSGNTIGIADFLGSSPKYDIEHTIPRSKSLDNSQMNKTLCQNIYNRDIKKNKIPCELQNHVKIMQRIKHWKNKYEDLYEKIERLKKATKAAADKESKDKLIQNRHYLQLEYNYWKGKYDRFAMKEVKQGFKNSQFVDTGIITKYAIAYLKSVFKKVYSVKGEMTAEFRKAWGLQKYLYTDENGIKHYAEKDRSNHIHHCVDAITIACMNKSLYDRLAYAWGLEEKGKYNEYRKELEITKPWKNFAQDVLNMKNETLIVHIMKDKLPVQTKKILRKRGKKQLNKNGTFIYQQGDTVRGSLHKDTLYGAIAKDSNGKINHDKEGNIIPNYVVRRELGRLKSTEVENIVDKNIREIIVQAVKSKQITFTQNGAKTEGTIWQNAEKQIPIRKVRIYASLKSPVKDFKKHAKPFLSDKKYKRQFNVSNDENYCMAIYEGENNNKKRIREFELITNIEAGDYYKLSNKKDRINKNMELIPSVHYQTKHPLFYINNKPFILKKGLSVLLLKSQDETIDWSNQVLLKNRLYIIRGLDEDGIKLYYHQEARPTTDVVKYMNEVIDKQKLEDIIPVLQDIGNIDIESIINKFNDTELKRSYFFKELNTILNRYYQEKHIVDGKGKPIVGKLKESKLTTPKGGDVINKFDKFPYIKFKVSNFHGLIQNLDFEITLTGKIREL